MLSALCLGWVQPNGTDCCFMGCPVGAMDAAAPVLTTDGKSRKWRWFNIKPRNIASRNWHPGNIYMLIIYAINLLEVMAPCATPEKKNVAESAETDLHQGTTSIEAAPIKRLHAMVK